MSIKQIKSFNERLISFGAAPAPITEPPTDLAPKCNPAECELPYCFCSKDGTIVPGGLDPEDVSFHYLPLSKHSNI